MYVLYHHFVFITKVRKPVLRQAAGATAAADSVAGRSIDSGIYEMTSKLTGSPATTFDAEREENTSLCVSPRALRLFVYLCGCDVVLRGAASSAFRTSTAFSIWTSRPFRKSPGVLSTYTSGGTP